MSDAKGIRRKTGACVAVNAALFGFLLLSVSLNKEYLRPVLTERTVLAVLSGSYSNFAAAWTIGVCPACAVLAKRLAPGRALAVVAATAVGAFAILTIEELTSALDISTVRDAYDVVASALGSSCAVLTFLGLRRIGWHKENDPISALNGSAPQS